MEPLSIHEPVIGNQTICQKFIKFGKVKVAAEALHENQLSNSNTFIMGVKGCPPVISTFLDKFG
jgi:hypothetical protein